MDIPYRLDEPIEGAMRGCWFVDHREGIEVLVTVDVDLDREGNQVRTRTWQKPSSRSRK